MANQILKVGIIGPKPFGLDSHAENDPYRQHVRTEIVNILRDLSREYTVVGLTGLSLGAEQDFAQLCVSENIDYIAYLICSDPERYWQHLPNGIIDNYYKLLSEAYKTVDLSVGRYTPKKAIQKKMKILSESDVIIYVWHKKIDRMNDNICQKLQDSGKTIYIIK